MRRSRSAGPTSATSRQLRSTRTGFSEPSPTSEAKSARSGAKHSSASDLKPSDLDVNVDSSFQTGDDVTVTATYPYDVSIFGVVVKSGRLNAKTTDRVE